MFKAHKDQVSRGQKQRNIHNQLEKASAVLKKDDNEKKKDET